MKGIKKILGGIGFLLFGICCFFLGRMMELDIFTVLAVVSPLVGITMVVEGMITNS